MLLNDLLEISRHDAGVAELSVEAVDLRDTVRSALENVGHLAGDAQIDLIVDMPTEEVIAEVDPRRVERILRNLIANAIDHAERKPVRIRMAVDEDTVAVTVRDYGVGSGGPTRHGSAAPAAPGSAWPSASRTPGCTRAGSRPGASPARAPVSGSPCR
jgi:K+-sensing histidine kinase KdpD